MAQGQNNLNITIGADTAKLRADLAQAQVIFREAQRNLNEAAKAGQTDRLQELGQTAQGAAEKVVGLGRAVREQTKAHADAAGAADKHKEGLRGLASELAHIARAAGLGSDAMHALRLGFAGFAAAEVIKGIGEVISRMNELNLAAKEANTTVGTIRGLGNELRAVGQDASKAGPILQGFFDVAKRARLERAETDRAAREAAADVLRRGGAAAEAEKAAGDVRLAAQRASERPGADPYGFFGVDPGRARTREGLASARQQAAQRALEMAKAPGADLDVINENLKGFNLNLETAEDLLQKIAKGGFEFPEPSPQAIQALKEYNEQTALLARAWANVTDAAGRYAATFVGEAAKALTSPLDIPGSTLEQRASGGLIRGPGTGTSDSIPAWLSNGEYVINAASVRQVGTGFLNAINGFRRFATGGAVSSEGSGFNDPYISNALRYDHTDSAGFWHKKDGSYSTPDEERRAKEEQAAAQQREEEAKKLRAWRAAHGWNAPDFDTGRGIPLKQIFAGVGILGAGGSVPGQGGRDTVPAMLTPGEFVINAASVRRLGAAFLHSLNGFAMGGFVGVPPMRFAAGGLMPPVSSGQPVHLHLGGQSFALSGATSVVGALVSEAQRQQVRSAGVKPSWFAGR